MPEVGGRHANDTPSDSSRALAHVAAVNVDLLTPSNTSIAELLYTSKIFHDQLLSATTFQKITCI